MSATYDAHTISSSRDRSSTQREHAALTSQDGRFRLHVLGTGSKGNAAILETPTTSILIDCGITGNAFLERCEMVGFDPARIDAVIITHEHTDHTSGARPILNQLAKRGVRPMLFTTEGTYSASDVLKDAAKTLPVCFVAATQCIPIGSIVVQFVPTSHDAADPVCMAFETTGTAGRDVLGYVTDTGRFPNGLTHLLEDARIIALEANHDEEMLARGPYPYYLKQRIASDQGHLSNVASGFALERILGTRLETVIGMHRSQTNNTHKHAHDALTQVISRNSHQASTLIGSQTTPLTVS